MNQWLVAMTWIPLRFIQATRNAAAGCSHSLLRVGARTWIPLRFIQATRDAAAGYLHSLWSVGARTRDWPE
jgi:hypothetical protein